MFRCILSICVIVFLALGAQGAVVFDPVPELPRGLEGLRAEYVRVDVSPAEVIGPMPRPQSDVSQGAETGDPNYYIEMSEMLGEMGGRLVRCDVFSDTTKVKVVDGKVVIDFSSADAICDALARAGAKPCWNIASFPEEMMDGNRPIADLLDQFIYQVTYHWNVEQKRGIGYYEYLNEPGGLDGERFAVVVKAAHRADPSVKVGGPAVMGCPLDTLEETVKYCRDNDLELGFLSFHLYYEMPEGYLEYVEKVEAILDKYPGSEDVEILLTEWGVDAGLNGSCDTLYNAAYYSSIMQAVMHKWPRVHPMHFEFRDGWDWAGPSRDLWGRWGMVTYPNLLPKPVYNAGVMWNRMASTEVRAVSSDPGVKVIAAKDGHEVTLLIWSWPREYERLLDKAPGVTRSPVDTPIRIRVDGLPFESQGIRVRRWLVDQTHSNVVFDPYSAELEKVQDVNLARTGPERGDSPTKGIPDEAFEMEMVLPLHGVTLVKLEPADRPPVNVVAKCDKFAVWAGERAKVTLVPKFDEEIDLELITDPANRSAYKFEKISDKPLSFYLTPPAAGVKSMRYVDIWARNTKSGAIGKAVLELQTDTPAEISREPDHVDASPVTRVAKAEVQVRNKTPEARTVKVAWQGPKGVRVEPASQEVKLAAGGTSTVKADVIFDKGVDPDTYPVTAKLAAGCEIGSIEVPVSLPLGAPKAKNVVIDGDLSEWKDVPSVKVGSVEDFDGHSYREWGGEADICGRIWAQWDREKLYLAFRVQDDEYVQKTDTWEMKDFDSVSIGFDLGRDALDPNRFFVDSDCDYVFGLFNGKGQAYRHWGAKREMGPADKAQIAAKQNENIITYELALDWKVEFAPYAVPEVGEVVGMTVYFTDSDTGKHEAEMRWGRGMRWDSKRPALFNSIWLCD